MSSLFPEKAFNPAFFYLFFYLFSLFRVDFYIIPATPIPLDLYLFL